jgi:hypothetical protein
LPKLNKTFGADSKHPIIQSFEPGEDWRWFYVHEAAVSEVQCLMILTMPAGVAADHGAPAVPGCVRRPIDEKKYSTSKASKSSMQDRLRHWQRLHDLPPRTFARQHGLVYFPLCNPGEVAEMTQRDRDVSGICRLC